MKRKLFTIGYTGFSLPEFIKTLVGDGIEYLIDTREIPISRKKGFSKSALASHLEQAGISYRHFRLLGSPKLHRHAVRESGDYDTFFRKVRKHIAAAEAHAQVREVVAIARKQTSCLMCCCPDWQFCHRRIVVEAINHISYFSIEHLGQNIVEALPRKAA